MPARGKKSVCMNLQSDLNQWTSNTTIKCIVSKAKHKR